MPVPAWRNVFHTFTRCGAWGRPCAFVSGLKDLTWAEQEAVIAASVTHPWVPPRLHADDRPLLTGHHRISRNGCKMFHYSGLLFSKLDALAKFGPWVGDGTSTASHLHPIRMGASPVNSWGLSTKRLGSLPYIKKLDLLF